MLRSEFSTWDLGGVNSPLAPKFFENEKRYVLPSKTKEGRTLVNVSRNSEVMRNLGQRALTYCFTVIDRW